MLKAVSVDCVGEVMEEELENKEEELVWVKVQAPFL